MRDDVVDMIRQLRDMTRETQGRLFLDQPGGRVTLQASEVDALLSAALVGAGEEGVAHVARAVAPMLADAGASQAAQTLLMLGGVLRRALPALERSIQARALGKSLGANVGDAAEDAGLIALLHLARASAGAPMPAAPPTGWQPDGSLLLGPPDVIEAIQEYLTHRGYLPPEPKPGGYGPADGPPVKLEVDPGTFEVRARAAVRFGRTAPARAEEDDCG